MKDNVEIICALGRLEAPFMAAQSRVRICLGQRRPRARAGSELAPRGCFLWCKEAPTRVLVHVRSSARGLKAGPAKTLRSEVCKVFLLNIYAEFCCVALSQRSTEAD